MNFFRIILPIAFLAGILLAGLANAQELQFAKIKAKKFFYCNINEGKVLIKDFSDNREIIKSQELRPRQVRNRRLKLVAKNKQLRERLLAESRKKRKLLIRNKIANNNFLRKKIVECQKKRIPPPPPTVEELDVLPVDLVIPEVFEATRVSIGSIPATCVFRGARVAPYENNPDRPILTARSGKVQCTLTQFLPNNVQRILLKVTRPNSNNIILFSEFINRSQIRANNRFSIAVCKEFPGCFYSNRLAKAVSEEGLNFILEPAE